MMVGRQSFLEQIIESTTGISGIGRCDMAISAAGVASFALNRGSRDEQFATIAEILLRNALRNGLGALKLGGGVEMAAILTGVEIRLTLQTLAVIFDFRSRRNDRSAQRTP